MFARPHRTLLALPFTAALLLVGCSDPSPAPDDPATVTSPQTVSTPDQPATPPQESPTPDEIHWDEAEQYPPISPDLLSEEAREAAAQASLPVLLPNDAELLAGAFFTTGDTWYTASMRTDEITLVFKGSSASRNLPGIGTNKEGDQPPGHVLTRTHQIVTLAFREFGAAYAIDIECARPTEDPRCTEDSFIIELAETAGIVELGQ